MQELQNAIGLALVAASLGIWLTIFRRLFSRQPILPREPRQQVPWTGIDVMVLALAWLTIELFVVRFSTSQAELLAGHVTAAALLAISAAHLLWAGLAILYLEQRTGAEVEALGFDAARLGGDARLGIVGFAAAVLPVYGTEFVVTRFLPQTDHPLAIMIRDNSETGLLAIAVLSAVVIAPLTEELMFRVILQGWLEKEVAILHESRGVRLAKIFHCVPILVSSLAFAAMHEGYERIALFVLALFFGFLYQQTHRIVPSLVLHMCINTLAVVGLSLGW